MGSLTRAFSAGSAVNCPCNDPACQGEEDVMDIGMLAAVEQEEEEQQEEEEPERRFLLGLGTQE
eukprot:2744992-Karenia_brevis.AAC.1